MSITKETDEFWLQWWLVQAKQINNAKSNLKANIFLHVKLEWKSFFSLEQWRKKSASFINKRTKSHQPNWSLHTLGSDLSFLNHNDRARDRKYTKLYIKSTLRQRYPLYVGNVVQWKKRITNREKRISWANQMPPTHTRVSNTMTPS